MTFAKSRRSIRLKDYDYTQQGAYFVTVIARARECLFGRVVDEKIEPSPYGEIVRKCWETIPMHFPNVTVDVFIVMPNHVHGIILVGARHAVPLHGSERFGRPVAGSLPTIIRSFKAAAMRTIKELHSCFFPTVWQRNYYEHIIRSEESLNHIREYILDNPARWEFDRENPLAAKPEPKDVW